MEKERLYYVDWLRVAVILSLVPYHAALTYTGLGDVYIKTPVKDIRVLPLLAITAPLDNFFMTLLFFLSGIATFYALQYKSRKEYTSERLNKVLIPFFLGFILLCPLQAYFKGLHEGFGGNLLQFLPEFFCAKIVDFLGYAHLWFLLYLFIISMACLPLFMKWRGDRARYEKITAFLCRGGNIYLPILFIIISETLLRPFFPGKQIIIMDWANDVVYPSVFIFGYVFASDVRIRERLAALVKPAMAIIVLCCAVFLYVYYSWAVLGSGAVYLTILWVLAKGFYECFAIIFLVGIGKKYFNRKSPALSYLSKASFTYYLYHFVPVSALTYLFLKSDLNMYVKYLLVILIAYAFLAVVYEIGVRRQYAGVMERLKPAVEK